MSHSAQDIIDTILSQLKTMANSETIVGEPINIGDVTILPVIKISVGFAAGGGEGSGPKEEGKVGMGGGGGGGGASISPVGFLIWDGQSVQFNAIGKGNLESLVKSVPELLKKFGFSKKGEGKGRQSKQREKHKPDEGKA